MTQRENTIIGRGRKRVTIEQWITTACSDADKGKPCSALSLIYLKGIGHEEIHTKKIDGPQNFAQLAEFFIDKACGYAQDLAGVSTFKMLAFYGSDEPQASFPFTVADGHLTAGDNTSYSKHDATPAGLLGQLMAHNERIMQMNMALTTSIATEGMALRRDLAEATMLVRDAAMSFTGMNHTHQMNVLQFQRETQERDAFAKALPALLNHVTGKEIVPEAFALSGIIDNLAFKVDDAKLKMLVQFGIVSPQEAQALGAHFAKVREEKEKRDALLKTIPSEQVPALKAKTDDEAAE